jgi:hypothetical protein
LRANRGALGFATREAQRIFGDAYVVAPQSTSFWIEDRPRFAPLIRGIIGHLFAAAVPICGVVHSLEPGPTPSTPRSDPWIPDDPVRPRHLERPPVQRPLVVDLPAGCDEP